jgi:hypothetical protein
MSDGFVIMMRCVNLTIKFDFDLIWQFVKFRISIWLWDWRCLVDWLDWWTIFWRIMNLVWIDIIACMRLIFIDNIWRWTIFFFKLYIMIIFFYVIMLIWVIQIMFISILIITISDYDVINLFFSIILRFIFSFFLIIFDSLLSS